MAVLFWRIYCCLCFGESPVVDEVIHVGVHVSNCGSISSDQVTERIRKARMTFFAMCGIGSSVKIPLVAVYMKIYWSLCVSSMCYGCECGQQGYGEV